MPSIFSYLDHREFLRDWIRAKKAEDPEYSYAAFARDGGCSKAAIANVLSGSRIPRPTTLDAFARAMRLGPDERNYLGLLVELASAQDVTRRREVMRRILASERFKQVRMSESESEIDVGRYLADWYLPAIRELAASPGFRDDPAWIASHLRPTITEAQAAEALRTLLELDLLERRPDGRVVQRPIQFHAGRISEQDALAHYHTHVIPRLLRQVDPRRRGHHLLAATVTLDEALVPEVRARLNAMLEQLAAMGDAEGHGRIYQIGVQMIPLTGGEE